MLPNGIGGFFKSDSVINDDKSMALINAYDSYRGGASLKSDATNVPLDSVEKIIQYYDQADEKAVQFVRDVEAGNIKLKEGETVVNAFATKYTSGIKQLGSNILSLGKNIATTFSKAVLSAGIMWLVSEGISLVAKVGKWLWDEVLTDNGKNKRRKEAVTRLNNRLSEYSEENKALSDLVSQYESLNEKLQDENITTSEMVDTKTDLLKLQEQIKDQYGKEAEGIDFVNGKYEEQIKKLEKLERKKAAQALYDPTNGILVPKGKEKKSDYEQAVDTVNAKPKSTKFNIGGGLGIENQSANDYWGFDVEGFTKRFEGLSISKESEFVNEFGQQSTGFYLNINPEWNNKEVDEAITEYIETLETEYENNPKVKKFKEAVTHDFKENVKYDATEYDAAEGMIDQTIRLITSTGVKGDPITQLEDAVDDYNTALAEYETTGSEDAKKKLQEAEKNLENAENYAKNLESIDKNLFNKINNQESGWDNYNDIIDQTLEGQSKTRDERFADKFKNANSELRALGDWAKKNLDESEFQWLESLLPEDVAALTLDDLKKLIEEAKEEAAKADIELQVEPTISDGVSKLNALDSAFDDDLTTAYSATKSSGGEATAKEIEAVNSAFGGTTFNSTDADNINVLSNAIEAYNEDLVQNAGDSAQAQVAHNKLITAYIDQNDVLKELTTNLDDVTEEQKKYYVEQLKSQGVENAQQVVDSRLTKQYRKHVEALKSLSKYITQNNKAFKDAVDTKDTEAKSITETTDLVKDLLKVYDDTGEEIEGLTPDIDPSFVIEHADDIEKAVEGDVDAIHRLRVAAAEKVLLDVSAESNLDLAQADIDTLMGLVAEADAMDIDVGATIEDSSFYQSLNNLMSATNMSVSDLNAVLSQIGFKAEYRSAGTHKITVPTVDLSKTNGAINSAKDYQQALVGTHEIEVDNFELAVTRVGSGGAGKSGIYNGGGGSKSSGGGSGSGSDSSDNDTASEDSEETFDWIEVAIQRIEEDISRLDTVIEDVYSSWGERNDKITEKIKKLTQEIEAQTTAYKEYMNYADKKIQINDGEAPNADDYENGTSDVQYTYDKAQYDEAVSQWATGEYQKKVREGLMTGEDIEKIQNQYLVEAINAYKEYYEKAIAAQDKVKELEITKKDQYKQLFENLIEEYEDDVTNIEKKADIINERINRTEELGFFVDKSYYDKLIEYEKQKNQQYATELQKVVDQFNTAVNEGKIQKGTAAWDEMYQSVMDVNKAYEESNTELVKLNNTIRQLQWDKFDWLEERLDDISAEADWLIGLLQGEDNYNDKGFLNNRGFAQAALVGAKYNDTLEKQKRYKEQIADIDKKIASGEYNKNDKEVIARKEELLKVYRDSISAAEEEKKAMQDLVRNGISKHIEALTELIDKYKESLSDAKDLYEYQKNLTNQTKNIADLEKQLAAYQGDNSEETRKKRQELQKQLNDAQQQLQETEWDRYISETNQMLDDMKTDYEKYLNDQTESITKVMMDMIPYINDNKTAIQNGLNEIKTEYGITTQHFENFANTQDGILSVFRNGDFASKLTSIHDVIKDFKTEMAKVTDTSNNGILGIVEKQSKDVSDIAATLGVVDSTNNPNKPKDNGTKGSKGSGEKAEDSLYGANDGTWKKDAKGDWYQYGDGSYAKNEYIDGYWLNSEGYWDSSWDGSWKRNDKGYWWEYSDGSWATNEWLKINGDWYYFDESGYMVTGKQTIGGKSYTFGKYGDLLSYAKGTKGSPRDQLAWTQENASELIYRTSDGAMLTPLNRGDMVFTHDMSQRLWEIAKGNIPTTVGLAVPNVGSSNVRNVTSNNNITIELPNVENYNDFKREMKQDKELEKFWQEITIGQAMGNNTLKKNRY